MSPDGRTLPGNAQGFAGDMKHPLFQTEEAALENGLKILILEDHAAPVISYQVHYAVGSRNERPGITGISHLFEHMMFKGTPDVGPEQFARTIQAHGGQLNAFTTEDNTSYYENLPAACLDLAIRLEADRQANLLLTEENLTSERQVVRNERLLRTVNTPYGLARELLLSVAFQFHPYRWPVVGRDSDLQAMTLQDCRTFFNMYYAPNNSTVVVVGDCSPRQVMETIENFYGGMARGPEPPLVIPVEDPQQGERRAIHRKTVEAGALLAGFHVPALDHPDAVPLLALSTLLSEGESSRLYRALVQSGHAGVVRSSLGLSFLNHDPTLFHIDLIANPAAPLKPLEAELWEEIDRLCQDGVDEAEVRRVSKQLQADLVLQARTSFYRGLQIGLYQVRAGDWRFVNSLMAGFMSLTADDITRVARTYLVPDNRTVVTVTPEND